MYEYVILKCSVCATVPTYGRWTNSISWLQVGWVVVVPSDNHIDNEFPEDAVSELPLDSVLPPETTD